MPLEKAMSSRLLTMKFMQRAAASSPGSTSSTPEGPPSKRARLSNGTTSPATPSSDLKAVQAALAEEELKRSMAIERQAAEAGETRWVLSVREPLPAPSGLRVVQTGFADIDSIVINDDLDLDDENMDSSHVGRLVAGRMVFGKKSQASKRKSSSSSSDSASESSEQEVEDEDDPTAVLIRQSRNEAAEKLRAERKAQKSAAIAESQRLASDRRHREINLNKLKTISGSGGAKHKPKQGGGKCFNCGEEGHMKANCPRARSR